MLNCRLEIPYKFLVPAVKLQKQNSWINTNSTCKILLEPFWVSGAYVAIPPPRILAFWVSMQQCCHDSSQEQFSYLPSVRLKIQEESQIWNQNQIYIFFIYRIKIYHGYMSSGLRKWSESAQKITWSTELQSKNHAQKVTSLPQNCSSYLITDTLPDQRKKTKGSC